MVKKTLLLLFLCFGSLFSQTGSAVDNKNNELKSLRNSIDKLETDLSKIKKLESNSRSVLQKYDQENLLLNRAINNLKHQEKIKTREIEAMNDSLKLLDDKIHQLEKEFGAYIRWLYMYGKESELKILFGSASFNQAVLRYKYFNYVSDRSEKTSSRLKSSREKILNLRTKIKEDIAYKNGLIKQKNIEAQKLLSRKKQKEDLIKQLGRNETNIAREIDEKRNAEIAIKNLIARLEEEERSREQKRHEQKLKGVDQPSVPAFNYSGFQSFAELKGRLNWPVSNGTIIRAFGENKNNRLNTVTLNYGVDIKTNKSTLVHCVAEGIISAIEWIPGYGSVVIVTHKGKYRTVYGHIADIEVSENEKVRPGDVIGKVNETLEGNIIHFEVWNERNYQNPEVWLARK